MTSHRILELYSGIGGMHCAWNDSQIPGEVVAAVDINTVANHVYQHNFPNTNLLNRNIQSIRTEEINKLQINSILMSPPCQPFTRNGKNLDDNDPRTNSFVYIIGIIEKLRDIEYILMENVKGFECSAVRDLFVSKLEQCHFVYQEFLLCPSSIGIPNSRLRYYCIARRTHSNWPFRKTGDIMYSLPNDYEKPYSLKHIIDECEENYFYIPEKLLKRANVLDICDKDSTRSCCFTKAYSHYVEGTGSVFTNSDPEVVARCYKEANDHAVGSEMFIDSLKSLQLRFFTAKEVLRLMTFPENYSFPQDITRKQCYRLLGNSINVKVVNELLKILYS